MIAQQESRAGGGQLGNPIVLLFPVVVWGLAPIFYKPYLEKMSPTRMNFLRTLFASVFLAIPFLVFGMNSNLAYGAASGLLTLAICDTLFFISIRLIGASIATPLLYVQTVLIQFIAPSIGGQVSGTHLVSGGLIILSVYLLSRGERTQIRLKGIAIGLLRRGEPPLHRLLKDGHRLARAGCHPPCNRQEEEGRRERQAELEGLCGSRGIVRHGHWARRRGVHILRGTIGIVISTIVLGLSPLMTQLGARLSKRESPSRSDFVAGALIVLAIGITVL